MRLAALTRWARLVPLALVAALTPAAAASAATSVSCHDPGDLQAAITAAAPGEVIEVGPGVCYEHLTIDKDLTLRGAGAGVTVVHGLWQDDLSTIRIDGPATIVIEDLSVTGGDGPVGGGIRIWGPDADVTMRRIEVMLNLTSVLGGGIEVRQATGHIEDSSIHDNHVTFPGGEAPFGGGGITNWAGSTLTVTGSAIYANSAGGIDTSGGGIYNAATLTLVNSTVSGNRAVRGGGGVYTFVDASVLASTITGNQAEQRQGSFFPATGGGIMKEGGSLELTGTILAGNGAASGPDCFVVDFNPTPITSLGHNLVGNADGCLLAAAGSDQVGNAAGGQIDPLLGPLADNGGPTLTHALSPGSPALDRIPPGECPVAVDQRGISRPRGAGCDIGAFEAIPADSLLATIGLVDQGSGRWHLRRPDATTTAFFFGDPGDHPLLGDWDGDGFDTPGAYRRSDGRVYLRNSNTEGIADVSFFFGNPGDVPIAGDWDGDGIDTISVFRPSTGEVFIINEVGQSGQGLGAADYSFAFGNPGDEPFIGDFNGDGIDTVGLHRRSTGEVYFRNTLSSGPADSSFVYGDPDDRVVAGDWDDDGVDTVGLYRPATATFHLRNSNTPGPADVSVPFGEAPWLPVAGQTG